MPPNGVGESPLPPTAPDATERVLHDIQMVNEQLLLASLREHDLAEQLRI